MPFASHFKSVKVCCLIALLVFNTNIYISVPVINLFNESDMPVNMCELC